MARAAMPICGKNIYMTVDAANEENVCPEGKEKSVGGRINGSRSSLVVKGLGRLATRFKNRFTNTTLAANAHMTQKAACLPVPLKSNANAASTQSAPQLPINDIKRISASIIGCLKCVCIQSMNR